MKLLAINASHRGDQGQTRFLIDQLFKGAAGAGAECEVVTLAKLKINRCVGCSRCQTGAGCVYVGKDDVQAIFAKMAEADIIIYATPVYIFNMTGLLKTFLDRLYGVGDNRDFRVTASGLMFHGVDAAICSKPFVALICCGNLEVETPKNVVAYFHTFSKFMDAPLVGSLVRNGGGLAGDGFGPEAARQFPKILEVRAAYEQAGRELAAEGRIRPATQHRANQEIVPVPLFGLLKRLPFKPLKRKFAAAAAKMRQ